VSEWVSEYYETQYGWVGRKWR